MFIIRKHLKILRTRTAWIWTQDLWIENLQLYHWAIKPLLEDDFLTYFGDGLSPHQHDRPSFSLPHTCPLPPGFQNLWFSVFFGQTCKRRVIATSTWFETERTIVTTIWDKRENNKGQWIWNHAFLRIYCLYSNAQLKNGSLIRLWIFRLIFFIKTKVKNWHFFRSCKNAKFF